MNTFFNIHYEFDKQRVHTSIARQLEKLGSDYICVVDGVVLGTAIRMSDYLRTVNGGMISICDSSYVPLYIHWIYGKRYGHQSKQEVQEKLLGKKMSKIERVAEQFVKRKPGCG